jgi:hypothetical protein
MTAAPRHVAFLLRLLRFPATAVGVGESEWDHVLRMARSARLHGVLAHRLQRAGIVRLPAPVAGQLADARAEAEHVRAMLLHELAEVRRALHGADATLMLLKGAAYVVQDLDCAAGRLPADLDILVRRQDLDEVERRLLGGGWESEPLGRYDRRYYREWMHQIPPMRVPGHVMELDLHHAILPPRGRLAIDTDALWLNSVPAAGGALRLPAPADLVLHAIVHLFVDSDCTNRLRDLVDIAALLDEFCARDDGFVRLLVARAHALGVTAAVAHAAAFLATWLDDARLGVAYDAARAPIARAIMGRRLAPPPPDSTPPCTDVLHAMLLARALWLRLPWHLALAHGAHKGWLALRGWRALRR